MDAFIQSIVCEFIVLKMPQRYWRCETESLARTKATILKDISVSIRVTVLSVNASTEPLYQNPTPRNPA